MTIQEIRESVSMEDVLLRYGLKANRKGFLCCPFHGEKTPSFKAYKRDFHCFGCGAHGTVFDFVMGMEKCGFHDAFVILGGTDEHGKIKRSEQLKINRANARAKKEKERVQRIRRELDAVNAEIGRCNEELSRLEEMSDEWCDVYQRLQMAICKQDELSIEEVKRWTT